MGDRIDEAVEVALSAVAALDDDAWPDDYDADDWRVAREAMRAAILAGVKVLLEPLAAEWRATASDLYFPDDSDCCARGRIEVENGTLKDCADRLESIYAPSLGEGDGR